MGETTLYCCWAKGKWGSRCSRELTTGRQGSGWESSMEGWKDGRREGEAGGRFRDRNGKEN